MVDGWAAGQLAAVEAADEVVARPTVEAYALGLLLPPDALNGVDLTTWQGRLQAMVALAQYADQAQHRIVAEARDTGVSYASVGAALGVSRQAAWERFSRG